MIEIETTKTSDRIQQGDILKDVDFIEKVDYMEGEIVVHVITFPLVIVLTQDCDLEQDAAYHFKNPDLPTTDDKKLLSVILAPIYNEGMFLLGEHLKDETINYKMEIITKTKGGKFTTKYTYLINNEIPRYHHLEFERDAPIVNSVIDFKHYFTVNIEYLIRIKKLQFVCKICTLYREAILQRFANFLSRIGLPNMK